MPEALARSTSAARRPLLALSFDVECYYQIVAKDYFGRIVAPTREVLTNTNWILDRLKESGARATFFFLGNVAETYPELVERAVSEGHEIGVHGDTHRYIYEMSPDEFRDEIASAMGKIRAAGAPRIAGHRATAFSIRKDTLWALDVLAGLGLAYDSSIFPFAGGRYGIAEWPRRPSRTEAGIPEVPMSVLDVAGRSIPCMGGGYVRYFPLAFTKWCARRLQAGGATPVSYFHPYEFESRPPRFDEAELARLDPATAKRFSRFNRMQGFGRGHAMRRKLDWIFSEFDTVPVGALVPS